MNYIVDEMRPLATVEKKSFRNMLQVVSNSNELPIPSSKALKADLDSETNKLKAALKETLAKQKFVCTTADVWTSRAVSYLGMTVHFIDEQLENNSFALTFKKMIKKQNFEYIGRCMNKVHDDFGLSIDKITHTVTDGGSNFCKAFRTYANHSEVPEASEDESSDSDCDSSEADSDLDADDEDESSENITIGELIPTTLNFNNQIESNDEEEIILPQQMRCSAHLLNLICQADVKKFLKEKNSDATYRNVLYKLGVFWRLTRKSDAAKKIVAEMCETQFPIPVRTRWNSYFNAIYKVFLKKEKIAGLFDKLKLSKLNAREWTFVDEYIKIMKPCAHALDTLQGEHEVTLGYVLPTIVVLKRKNESISHLNVCQNIKAAVLRAIDKRFPIIDLKNPKSKIYILAAVSHPKFKMSWVDEENLDMVKHMFTSECVHFMGIMDASSSDKSSENNQTEDDFFSELSTSMNSFNSDRDRSLNSSNLAESQALNFLSDKHRTKESLHKYEVVKNIFLKYNTSMPSSAPVERLFSTALQIFTPRRNKLSAKTFSMLLLSKYNGKLLSNK